MFRRKGNVAIKRINASVTSEEQIQDFLQEAGGQGVGGVIPALVHVCSPLCYPFLVVLSC